MNTSIIEKSILLIMAISLLNCSGKSSKDATLTQQKNTVEASGTGQIDELQTSLVSDTSTSVQVKETLESNPAGTSDALGTYNRLAPVYGGRQRPGLIQFLQFFMENEEAFSHLGQNGQSLIELLQGALNGNQPCCGTQAPTPVVVPVEPTPPVTQPVANVHPRDAATSCKVKAWYNTNMGAQREATAYGTGACNKARDAARHALNVGLSAYGLNCGANDSNCAFYEWY